MPPQDGWPALFTSAFLQSRNAMVLVDEQRRIVDANPALLQLLGQARGAVVGRPMWELVVDGPQASPAEWRELLSAGRFTGDTVLRHADGRKVAVQWGASTEVATGRRLVLFVILNTSRWGGRFRPAPDAGAAQRALSPREREVVRLIAVGATGPEIADELRISHDTVRTHARNAMSKVGARSRAHLVAKALGEDYELMLS
jgi:PAS domain S-box-containing protein